MGGWVSFFSNNKPIKQNEGGWNLLHTRGVVKGGRGGFGGHPIFLEQRTEFHKEIRFVIVNLFGE